DAKGFIPGDGRELSLSARAGALERRGDPARMIHVLGHRQYPRARSSLAPRMTFIPFEPNHLSVSHVKLLAASAMAARSCRPGNRPEFFNGLFGLHESVLLTFRTVCSRWFY